MQRACHAVATLRTYVRDMRGHSIFELPDGQLATELRRRSVDQLLGEAEAQEAKFLGGLPSSDAAAVELFRRAIDLRDEAAWNAVVALYRGLLVAHSGRLAVRGLVHEDDRFCVDRAFERFWLATRANGLSQFADVASILKYLKLCLASVLLDEARARRRQAATSLDDIPPEAKLSEDPAGLVTSRGVGAELWAAVQAELKSDEERIIARDSFVFGLTPRHIRERYPTRFPDVGDVYRLKRNIVERLRHSPTIQALRG